MIVMCCVLLYHKICKIRSCPFLILFHAVEKSVGKYDPFLSPRTGGHEDLSLQSWGALLLPPLSDHRPPSPQQG